MPNPEKSFDSSEPFWKKDPRSSNGSTIYLGKAPPPEIIRQMPDHLEPGSLLHSLRCRPTYFLWMMIEDTALEKNPRIYNAFYQHLNKKHFRGGKK